MITSAKVAAAVIVHLPESRMANPRQLSRQIVKDLWGHRYLAWEMFRRDLVSQQRQSFFGLLFLLLPVLVTVGWAVLFREAKIINAGDVPMPYPFFVLLGMLIWSCFTEAIDAPISGLVSERWLISKSNVSAEVVTLSKLLQVVFNLLVKAVVVAVAAACYGLPPKLTVLLAPLALGFVIALGAGIGLILAPINLLYRDVSRAVPVVMTFWFFLTPILFLTADPGPVAFIMNQLNPMTPLLATARDLAFGGIDAPSFGFVAMAAASLLVLFGGLMFSRIATPIVIDRANA
jgi:lipopolysaccharide transport system permease protein